ncbi:MAG: hypothetical protein JJE04_13160 [Acidobacteriia bacterium]|nr:hypothetical protein [Terriglobia bacterium]
MEGNGDRMDRFERGLEHLLETQAGQQTTIDKILEAQRKNEVLMGQALEAINSLARIAQSHERRPDDMEGRR